MTQAVFSVTGSLNDFFWPLLILTDDKLKPIALKLYALNGMMTQNEYLLAMLIVTFIAAIIFLMFQKYIVQGISLGGIKE